MQHYPELSLSIENLAAQRGEMRVFSGISLSLKNGGAVIITGHNGSGKSTFLRVLAGLLPRTKGQICLTPDTDIPFHEHCHYLGHLNALKAAMSVEENLSFWQGFSGERLLPPDEALEEVGLGGIGHLPGSCLSAGQKRRVAIARLLVVKKPVWLLDEPTAALDSASEKRFEEICSAHLQAGGMIIVATHQPLSLPNTRSLVFEASKDRYDELNEDAVS